MVGSARLCSIDTLALELLRFQRSKENVNNKMMHVFSFALPEVTVIIPNHIQIIIEGIDSTICRSDEATISPEGQMDFEIKFERDNLKKN